VELTGRLRRFALARAHLFLVEAPGGVRTRLAAERAARERGWPLVDSPADADVLVVCGGEGAAFDEVVDQVWAAVPAPRWLLRLAPDAGVDQVGQALPDARDAMLERPGGNHPQLAHALARPAAHHANGDDHPHSGHRHGDGNGHGDVHSPGDGEGEGGHAVHGGGMEMLGGLTVAERAADRDGLQLDVLHVPLGPALPDWPAGLRLRLALQGDVAQQVELDPLPSGEWASPTFWDRPWLESLAGKPVSVRDAERHRATAHLDSLARLLRLAGLAGDVRRCRRLRDDLLDGTAVGQVQRGFAPVAGRLRHSRLLHWSLDGIGVLDAGAARQLGVTGPALRAAGADEDLRRGDPAYPGFTPVVGHGGDVTARLLQWVGEIEASLAMGATSASQAMRPVEGRHESPRGVIGAGRAPSVGLLEALPRLLTGLDLAMVRLVVASLDPDLAELQGWRPLEAAHG
jgi:Respiratory-chain NADH dehydrogenase, 49 Kd subunit